MQYVRSISGTAYNAWQSINPATLSGAIDVIVVEQDDGSLACSPFHIRFGKWRLLRPSEKKVDFRVNGHPQECPMKLGEGGEAFFVFETSADVPEALLTSPLVSPAGSPDLRSTASGTPSLQEPDPFELDQKDVEDQSPMTDGPRRKSASNDTLVPPSASRGNKNLSDHSEPLSSSAPNRRPLSANLSDYRPALPSILGRNKTETQIPLARAAAASTGSLPRSRHASRSPSVTPIASQEDAKSRAMNLSKKLWTSNISNQVTESGDLMLDMTGFNSSEGEALHAEVIARQLLSQEIDGPYDIGALIGPDEHGNVWIYSSEEAKESAGKKAASGLGSYNPAGYRSTDAVSDPGYHSDDTSSESTANVARKRRDSDSAVGLASQPSSPERVASAANGSKQYAKTLRLTSEQLKAMDLRPGANPMTFTVNRATCRATLWYWKHNVPIVISDIDGTITKSDVLGHVMNTIGRDWTHAGVAKLYTEIAANGYNFIYLTSRSVGQADTTRNYLDGITQEGTRLPGGPVLLSPDRTIAALRREVYLRKPEIFKMACLRDIMALFTGSSGANSTIHESQSAGLRAEVGGLGFGRTKGTSPFYAGFGNRLTDALSYRSVNIPSTRIFTINTDSEISLDLLSLNKYRTAYSTMREIVDHFFPPVGLLIPGGAEEYTDFNYWRNKPLDIVDFTDSEGESEDRIDVLAQSLEISPSKYRNSILSEDEAGDVDEMMDSYQSELRASLDESLAGDEELTESMVQEEGDDGDDELGVENGRDDSSSQGDDDAVDDDVGGGEQQKSTRPFTPPHLPGQVRADPQTTPRRSTQLPVRSKAGEEDNDDSEDSGDT